MLRDWEPKVRAAISNIKGIEDVDTDTNDKGLQTSVIIDRDTATVRLIERAGAPAGQERDQRQEGHGCGGGDVGPAQPAGPARQQPGQARERESNQHDADRRMGCRYAQGAAADAGTAAD